VKAAESAFREALKLNPDDFTANLYLGAILYRRRELEEAKTYLERALQLDPSSTMAGYEVGMLESSTGQYEAAAEELEKVVKEDPSWLEPHVELASLYYKPVSYTHLDVYKRQLLCCAMTCRPATTG